MLDMMSIARLGVFNRVTRSKLLLVMVVAELVAECGLRKLKVE